MDVKTFRDNLFAMNTRRFGTVMEMVVKNLTDTNFSDNIHYDLKVGTGINPNTKIEVKFSRAERKHTRKVTDYNVLDVIQLEGLSLRMFPYGDWKHTQFDCNIQQVKKNEFDVLFYGVLFADRVVIFMATPEQINENMNYSNRQHKGNEGEGQFHINQKTLQYHMDNQHFVTLSYVDMITLLTRFPQTVAI